jgi:hypothetical protein
MTLSPIQGASREWSLHGLKPIARYGSNALNYSNKDYMSCLNLLALGNALSESTTMGWVCVCVCVCVWRAGGRSSLPWSGGQQGPSTLPTQQQEQLSTLGLAPH